MKQMLCEEAAHGILPERPDGLQQLLEAPPQFVELLPIAAYACDGFGRVLWFNRLAAALWGRSPRIGDDTERFCGSYKLYFGGRQIGREETPMAHALRTGEPVQGVQGIVERPDGSRVWAMVHIAPVKDPEGRVIGAINCFHDTTELHALTSALEATKQELQESEERFRQLLEALPAAVYTTDADGRITYYNKQAMEMAGRAPELGSDKWCVSWRLYQPDGTPLPHDECPMAITLRENRPVRNVEALAERPDGTLVPFLPYPTPLHDAGGKVVGAVNMLIDISERKQAEANQRMLLLELNHRVKNNMQMLHALLRAAERETADAKARSVLGNATQRVGAMAAAQQVLYAEGAPTTFQGRDFINAVCAAARAALEKDVSVDIDADDALLPNDVAMPLALIINELLTNAAKHGSNAARTRVHVSLRRDERGCELRIKDDGPGFEFDTTVLKRSSGLGLVAGLARQIGGTFAVERQSGCCCVVQLPDRRCLA